VLVNPRATGEILQEKKWLRIGTMKLRITTSDVILAQIQVTSRSSSGNQVVRSVSVEHSHVMELGLLSLTFILPETTLVAMLRTFYRHYKVAELQQLHHLLTSTDQCRQELMVGI
jgi:hypothetical protein